MNNGSNNWNVPYSSIKWIESTFLKSHENVSEFSRSNDILFAVTKKRQGRVWHILLVNTYLFGVADYYKAKAEFPTLTCIALTGNWNNFTEEALQLGRSENTGMLKPNQLYGALS